MIINEILYAFLVHLQYLISKPDYQSVLATSLV